MSSLRPGTFNDVIQRLLTRAWLWQCLVLIGAHDEKVCCFAGGCAVTSCSTCSSTASSSQAFSESELKQENFGIPLETRCGILPAGETTDRWFDAGEYELVNFKSQCDCMEISTSQHSALLQLTLSNVRPPAIDVTLAIPVRLQLRRGGKAATSEMIVHVRSLAYVEHNKAAASTYETKTTVGAFQ